MSSIKSSTPGSLISAYQILERIGAGSSGTVYRCHPIGNKKLSLALKVLHQRIENTEQEYRFARECETQRKLLGAPGVVTLVDHGIEMDGTAWMVIELFSVNYAERLVTLDRIPLPEVIDLGYQLATTLAQAQTLHIVHGDIKPANIFLSNEGYAALGDFGSSVDLNKTITLNNTYSFAYAAPEVLQQGAVSHQSDLYSLGAALFHLASGESPLPKAFRDANALPLGTYMKHCETADPPVLVVQPAYRPLTELVAQLMAPLPNARPVGAKEVARRFKSMQTVHYESSRLMKLPHAAKGREPESSARSTVKTAVSSVSIDNKRVLAGMILSLSLVAGAGGWKFYATPSTAVPTHLNAFTCQPAAMLCEDFENGLASWETHVDESVAALQLKEDDKSQVLTWVPTEREQPGKSFLYRIIAKPATGNAVRVRLNLNATDRSTDYFWMTVVQFNSSNGQSWSLNWQRIRRDKLAFDLFYQDAGGDNDDAIGTEVPFPFDRWMCVELIIDPSAQSALQLFVDGTYVGQLNRSPVEFFSRSYELVLGSTDAQSPATAPNIQFDNVTIDRGNEPACTM